MFKEQSVQVCMACYLGYMKESGHHSSFFCVVCSSSTSVIPVPPNGNELCLVFLEMPDKLLPPRFYLAHSESTLATGDYV